MQILVLPTRVFNHGAQRTDGKCLTQGMKRNDDPTPVGVPVNAMTTSNSLKYKSVCFQRADETTSRQASRGSRHTSYIDNNGGLWQLDGSLVHRNRLPGFQQVLNVQVDSFAYIRQRFFIAMSPSMATPEGGARRVPSVPSILEFVRLYDHLKDVGFHSESPRVGRS